jgi:hypothetical protein
VHVVELSNHPGDMLDDAARGRVAAERRVHSVYEHELIAGIEGERLVAAGLGRALDDDWTLLHGYRNRRGEIDHLIEHDHAFHDKRRRARSR